MKTLQLSKLPAIYRDAVWDYSDTFCFDPKHWTEQMEYEESKIKFALRNVPIGKLETATYRPLTLSKLDMSMVGQTYSAGMPLLLDSDYSVIDGMHRLADIWKIGKRTVQAWVRIATEAGAEHASTPCRTSRGRYKAT